MPVQQREIKASSLQTLHPMISNVLKYLCPEDKPNK